MKILILGAAGMLGKALVSEAKTRKLVAFDADQCNATFCFDITKDEELTSLIKTTNPDILINTVAIVSHDICEKNRSKAYMVNARPASIIAQLAKKMHFFNIHISTDHFYTNDKEKKHTEDDPVCLLNEYARTKYIAECFALTHKKSLVIRTNIVGFRNDPERPTFVEWVIKSLQNKTSMTLFNDYYTSSIDVKTFSKILFDLIEKKIYGTLNIAAQDVSSKQMFIESLAQQFNPSLKNCSIGSVRALPGTRAESAGLDVTKAETLLAYKLPTSEQVINNLVKEYQEKQRET